MALGLASCGGDSSPAAHVETPGSGAGPGGPGTPGGVYHTVTFVTYGGGTIPPREVANGTAIGAIQTLTRSGHSFLGWYTNAAFTQPFNPASLITSATTLHARWQYNVSWVATSVGYPNTTSITFEFSGHVSGLTVNDITLEPTNLTGSGYPLVYKGALTQTAPNEWSLAVDVAPGLVLVSIDRPGVSAAVQQLGVIYESNHGIRFVRITFDTAGGDPLPPMDILAFTHRGWDLPQLATLPTPTRGEYTFIGWCFSPEIPPGHNVNEDMTATASWIWIQSNFTVSFDMQGATSAQIEPQTVLRGTTATRPPNPTRTGFTFVGWSWSATGVALFHFEWDTITEDTTLHARWGLANWTAVQAGTGVGQSTFASNQAINDIAYSSGTFIAVGAGGRMARSTDGGQNWTPIDPGTGAGQSTFASNQAINDIAYGSGTFIAVGSGGRMARSTDGGRNWMPIESGQGAGQSTFESNHWLHGIAYGSGTFIAVGSGGRMARSTDGGRNWMPISAGTGGTHGTPGVGMIGGTGFANWMHILSIAYGGGQFIATGQDFGRTSVSTNGGQTWSPGTHQAFTLAFMDLLNIPAINAIAHGGNTFIAGALGRLARRPADGGAWVAIFAGVGAGTSRLAGAINAIAYGNGSFVAGDATGQMSYSRDNGVTWTPIGNAPGLLTLERSTFARNQAINGIAHGSGRFIAVGANGKMSIGVQD